MKVNVGGIDRLLRIVLGAALILWAAVLSGPAWAWIGVIPLATGLVKFCPVYTVLGMTTCPTEKK